MSMTIESINIGFFYRHKLLLEIAKQHGYTKVSTITEIERGCTLLFAGVSW